MGASASRKILKVSAVASVKSAEPSVVAGLRATPAPHYRRLKKQGSASNCPRKTPTPSTEWRNRMWEARMGFTRLTRPLPSCLESRTASLPAFRVGALAASSAAPPPRNQPKASRDSSDRDWRASVEATSKLLAQSNRWNARHRPKFE
jgi:hypothetical protein